MFVVLCDVADTGALWFAAGARRSGAGCVVVTSDLLSFARRRSHRLGAAGVSSIVALTDDTIIDRPAFVLNRLLGPPDAAWRRAAAVERNYATAELTAFTLSWLGGLDCPVRNRPDPNCLAGPAPHPLVLAAAAARAGLDCPDVTYGTHRNASHDVLLEAAVQTAGRGTRPVHVVCLDGEVVGSAVPPRVADGLREFASTIRADQALIGVDFLVAGERWWFAGMSPFADLPAAGPELVHRLLSLSLEPVR